MNTGDASQVRFFFNRLAGDGTGGTAPAQWDYDTSGSANTGDFSQIRFFFNNVAAHCP